jgi:protein-L-isoaspartate O-methyltransferase
MIAATYSPEDNKLRLYPSSRLEPETYARVKAAGFSWAPKQELFVAPAWSPSREDLCVELAGEIGDEDTSLVDRAEQRAERFEDYSEKRETEADRAKEAVSAIADNIPFGQPILVGHHSEKHARKDAEKIQNGMRKAVKLWELSRYWEQRAAGAVRAAKYKELPAVRARRIKGLEADLRKEEKTKKECEDNTRLWEKVETFKRKHGTAITPFEMALIISDRCHVSRCFPVAEYPRVRPDGSTYEGAMSLWSALDGGVIGWEKAREIALASHARVIASCGRWIAHLSNRINYERAMLKASGGTAADKTGPEKGGACRCWASPRGGWAIIQKVNKVSVTLLDNWGNGGKDFTRTIPFDKLSAVMTKAQVDEARTAGRLVNETPRGFGLVDTKPPEVKPVSPTPEKPAWVDQVKDSLSAGVRVVVADNLFPTPPEIARKMVDLAGILPGHKVLEPSAGTGNLVSAILKKTPVQNITAVENAPALWDRLPSLFQGLVVRPGDFLEKVPAELGTFHRIIMNPPFDHGSDVKHIQHARTFLGERGRLVALCANGPKQNEVLRPLSSHWEELPAGSFAAQGTGVNVVLLVIDR